jgi:NhaD family Na+/H+ antiporter
MIRSLLGILATISAFFTPAVLAATEAASHAPAAAMTHEWVGYACLIIFVVAYAVVMGEEFTHLRKSKPVILAAGVMWLLIAIAYHGSPQAETVAPAIRHNLMEYAELFLFLLAAMTYINALDERLAFDALRSWLIRKGFGYRKLFWVTGWLAFFISPVADNLTTALLMCAVLLSVGAGNPRFVGLGCVNVVIAANAGGAFSPFGDITTLMVWQKGIMTPQGLVDFWSFFMLFVPSVVNYFVPAMAMHFAVPDEKPTASDEIVVMKRGAKRIMFLFVATIVTAVSFHNFFHLPPMLGMMTGMAYLQFFGYFLKKTHRPSLDMGDSDQDIGQAGDVVPFDVFRKIARAEWDTLLFFYGVIMCVGALGFLGYLAMASQVMYVDLGPTTANILVGLLSAIVDNIPVMFAVLGMSPDMSMGQWLLVTLTAGVGGSLLSIGSAAGVALMGQARGQYTFFGHLKWTWAIALGYAASIAVHMLLNQSAF